MFMEMKTAPLERPYRILLLLGWLNGGGAERVAVQLFNNLHGRMIDMRMALLRRAGPYLERVTPDRVLFRGWCERWFPQDGANATFYRPDRFLRSVSIGPWAFRSMIREADPDVVMSFTKGPNVLAYLALRGMRGKRPRWIAREGNNIGRSSTEDGPSKVARSVETGLVGAAYRAADCVVANSAQLAARLQRRLGLRRGRMRVLHNPVDIASIVARSAERGEAPSNRPFLLSAGRLTRQKGHDLLLRAFAASRYRDGHDLVIIGEGPELPALQVLAAELGIGDSVRFLGFAANPWAWMARAELFVLPSRWEGFPNALLEAMACGAAVLATDCDFGPGEIIDHGGNGWLSPCEDAVALGDAIDTLLAAPELRHRLGAEAALRAAEFRHAVVLPQFEALLREQAGMPRPSGANPDAGMAAPGLRLLPELM
jgi:glycosyltransferase involved in cell wall biosynthesis